MHAWSWGLLLMTETFDIRVEVQAPVNGSEAYNGGVPSSEFSVVIAGGDSEPIDITQFFSIEDPEGTSVPSNSTDRQSSRTTSPTTKTYSLNKKVPRPLLTSSPNRTETSSYTSLENTPSHSPTMMDRPLLPSGRSCLCLKSQRPRTPLSLSEMVWRLR